MPVRHEELIRMLRVRVSLSQFSSDRFVKPTALLLQLPVRESFCGFWVDGQVGRSACYRSRRVKARRPFSWLDWQGERDRCPSRREEVWPGLQSPGTERCSTYSGGGRRLCSFLSSRPFQYLKLLSKCCIRLGRSAKAGEKTK